MLVAELETLTSVIDTYNYEHESMITPESLHTKLWHGLNKLREAENKDTLIKDWKYKKDLELVEESHVSYNNSHVNVGDWEQRYVVAFWLSIYH
jgi:hypothetical protein